VAVNSWLRNSGPMFSASVMAMPADAGAFRVGSRTRRCGCGLVPRLPQLSAGRHIGWRGKRGPRRIPVGRWQDPNRCRGLTRGGPSGRTLQGTGLSLDGQGCDVRFRRRANIRAPGFLFDAAITGGDDRLLVGMGKQKEAEAKGGAHGRHCDEAEGDEVEQDTPDSRLRCRGALIRGIAERIRHLGGLWTRVLGRASRRAVVPGHRTTALQALRRGHSDRPFPAALRRYGPRKRAPKWWTAKNLLEAYINTSGLGGPNTYRPQGQTLWPRALTLARRVRGRLSRQSLFLGYAACANSPEDQPRLRAIDLGYRRTQSRRGISGVGPVAKR
jgi:hypothetical protein